MTDFQTGLKKEVAEIKFLIHDMRVEKFINDVIHFHVTLNTDLEIYDVEQVAQLHGEDLLELKTKAQAQRRALQVYSSAVKHFSPPETIISAGREYIGTIQDICELIINPLWGRFERVMSFLPRDSRSFKSVNHYRNCLRWICGVYYRIEHFLEEGRSEGLTEEFDLGHDVEDFTRHVIRGYVTEKSSSRVDIYYDRIESAVVRGNRHRFRRMLFNLVMNAVDAMSEKTVGELRLSVVREDDQRLRLTVSDTGGGMTEEKREQLLSDPETREGELPCRCPCPSSPIDRARRDAPPGVRSFAWFTSRMGTRSATWARRSNRRGRPHRQKGTGGPSCSRTSGSPRRITGVASSSSRSPKRARWTSSPTSPTKKAWSWGTKTSRRSTTRRRCAAVWKRTAAGNRN